MLKATPVENTSGHACGLKGTMSNLKKKKYLLAWNVIKLHMLVFSSMKHFCLHKQQVLLLSLRQNIMSASSFK